VMLRIWNLNTNKRPNRDKKKKRKKISQGSVSTGFSTQYFDSETAAATAWSESYRGRSIQKEYAAFIYVTAIGGEQSYYSGRTLSGMRRHGIVRANVVIPFFILYFIQSVIERLKRKAKIAAFVHTHPKPALGYTSSFLSGEDRLLLKLPRIIAVYVIPYENQEMIRAHQ
jgi:hypothetical protein